MQNKPQHNEVASTPLLSALLLRAVLGSYTGLHFKLMRFMPASGLHKRAHTHTRTHTVISEWQGMSSCKNDDDDVSSAHCAVLFICAIPSHLSSNTLAESSWFVAQPIADCCVVVPVTRR